MVDCTSSTLNIISRSNTKGQCADFELGGKELDRELLQYEIQSVSGFRAKYRADDDTLELLDPIKGTTRLG